jgi:hypothetical protein
MFKVLRDFFRINQKLKLLTCIIITPIVMILIFCSAVMAGAEAFYDEVREQITIMDVIFSYVQNAKKPISCQVRRCNNGN